MLTCGLTTTELLTARLTWRNAWLVVADKTPVKAVANVTTDNTVTGDDPLFTALIVQLPNASTSDTTSTSPLSVGIVAMFC
jgi:hypothetical protein